MKKSLFLLPILFLFCFAGKAYATTAWSYTGTPQLPINSAWHIPGSTGNIFLENPTAQNAHDFNSVFGSTPGHLKSMTITVFKYYAETCSFSVTAYNANSNAYTTSDTKTYTKAADGWGVETGGQTITLNFDSTFNMGDVSYFHFNDVTNSCITDNMFYMLSVDKGGVYSNWSGYNYNQGFTMDPVMTINSDIPDTTRSIVWSSDFTQGLVSTDFKYWNACVNIPPQSGNTDTGIFLYADYNTFGGNNADQISDNSGYIISMDPAVGYHGCIIFNKTHDLVPGRYQATISLYTGTGSDPQYFGYKVKTDALYFRIIAGSGADLPNNTVQNDLGFPTDTTIPTPTCPQTSFRIFSVDFGKGLCTVINFLFVPSSLNETQTFANTQTLFQSKAPFAYFYELKSSFSGVSTSASSGYFISTTLTSKDRNGNVLASIPFQFLNTADTQTKGIFDNFRVYISAALWFGFAVYLLTRAYRFFRPV
jgi:hypothetical protein